MGVCPYNPYLPAIKNMYFGLREDLAYVLETLQAPFPPSPLIVGGRRVGKTSFLKEIERLLAQQGSHMRTVYVDLNSLPMNPKPSDLFYRIARTAAYQITGVKNRTGEMQAIYDDSDGFERLINYITELAEKTAVSRVVIMLDELELIKQSGWLASVLRNFQSVMADTEIANKEKGGLLAFAATTSREDIEIEIADFGVPVMRFQIVSLRALRQNEFHDLVNKPVKEARHRLPLEIEERIWMETGGHPHLVHWILTHLWEKHKGNLRLSEDSDVSEGIGLFFTQNRSFELMYYTAFGTLERELYWMILESKQPLSRKAIKGNLLVPVSRIDFALRLLMQSGIVRIDGDGYTWNGSMFKDWVTEQGHYLRQLVL